MLEALVAQQFPEAATAVEIGCGTGAFTEWLHTRGIRSTGVDLSAAMLAARLRPAQGRYVQGEAVRLPFGPAQFDVAVMVTTLEFLDDPWAALREATRVARRGILLGVLNRWSWTAICRRFAGRFSDSVYRYARFYSPAELRRLVSEAVDAQVSHSALRFAWGTRSSPVSSYFLALAVTWV